MNPSQIRAAIVTERIAWIRKMIEGIRRLPLSNYEEFISDSRNIAAAESYLRRALEAVLDLGRHILSKGFASPVTEYKEIGKFLAENGVLNKSNGELLRQMAGYRNRLVHFYHEVSERELFDICTNYLADIEDVTNNILNWLKNHPEKLNCEI